MLCTRGILNLRNFSSVKMSEERILIQHTNQITGKKFWKIQDKEYDYHHEIARSSYGDMLNDNDRNKKYFQAIKFTIEKNKLENPNKKLVVLDIGTGTGLLSMMAAQAGADLVYACESFLPMAKCAKKVIESNGFNEKIKIIEKDSKNIVIGKDMEDLADILVSEIFDTELLGESALNTFLHAKENLITKDAVVIPSEANIYMLPGESSFVWSHNYLNGRLSNAIENLHLNCHGCPSVFDLQASQLELTDKNFESSDPDKPFFKSIVPIKNPIKIDTINFKSEISLKKSEIIGKEKNNQLKACCDGTVNCFILWWDLVMEPSDTCPRITTAPKWQCEQKYSWREHWMQSIFFPRLPVPFYQDENFLIEYRHDGLTFSFEIHKPDEKIDFESFEKFCDCSIHMALSRQRIAYLNSSNLREHERNLFRLIEMRLKEEETEHSVNLIIQNTGSFLPFQIDYELNKNLKKRINKVFIIDENHMFRKVIKAFIDENACSDSYVHIKEDLCELLNNNSHMESLKKCKNLVISEPFIDSSTLPWEHLTSWYTTGTIKGALPAPYNIQLLFPYKLTIFVMAVELQDLHKIRQPIKECEGFHLTEFNQMITKSSSIIESEIEAHPLWQYPNKSFSMGREVISIDLSAHLPVMQENNQPKFSGPSEHLENQIILDVAKGPINALVFWTEWGEDHDTYSSSGPLSSFVGEEVVWPCVGENQGVMFFNRQALESFAQGTVRQLKISTKLNIETGEFKFTVNI